MPVFEAFAAGVPGVVSAFPGHEEHIHDGVNALVAPVDDYAAAAAAITALRDAPERLARLRQGARETAAALGWDQSVACFEAALEERLAGPRQRAQTPLLARYRQCYLDILTLWAHNTTLLAAQKVAP